MRQNESHIVTEIDLYRISLANYVRRGACAALLLTGLAIAAAQEKPYFVTYSHDLEEPGNLEIETKISLGRPQGGDHFGAMATEFEYGVRAWWTSEFYLDGQTTPSDSTVSTGFRIENRFRPLMKEHFINPVLYVEYENINGADKTALEIVGHDGQSDLGEPNGDAREEHKHEGEFRLILSSNVHDWNISENFIAEKNLGHEPWEFGYGGRDTVAEDGSRPARMHLLRGEADCGRRGLWRPGRYLAADARTTPRTTSRRWWAGICRDRACASASPPVSGLTGGSLDRVYRVGFA